MVLVIEANAAVRELDLTTKEEEGCVVTSVLSRAAALAVLREQPVDLVLTDLFRIRGQELLQSIAPLLEEAAPLPVGVLTGWSVSASMARQAGVTFVLEKLFDLDELLRAIRQAMPARFRQGSGPASNGSAR